MTPPPAPRTPADIITPPGQENKDRTRGPAAAGKWLTASVTGGIPAVIAAAFDEAGRRDPGHRRPWTALVDGNRTQIEAIEAEAGRRGVTVTVICDFVHVLEYTWKAAWSFFDKGDPDAETWVAAQAVKILQGKAAQVAGGIRRRATTFGYAPAEREGADACAGYLTAKKPYLDYATALANGWSIATGVIEGACRHLVKDRMDITGARWSPDGAEAILKLRALISNGDFESTGVSTCAENTNASTTPSTAKASSWPHNQLTLKESHPSPTDARGCHSRNNQGERGASPNTLESMLSWWCSSNICPLAKDRACLSTPSLPRRSSLP